MEVPQKLPELKSRLIKSIRVICATKCLTLGVHITKGGFLFNKLIFAITIVLLKK